MESAFVLRLDMSFGLVSVNRSVCLLDCGKKFCGTVTVHTALLLFVTFDLLVERLKHQ